MANDDLIDLRSVSVRDACSTIPCGVTRLYQLLAAGELESFLDGKSRRITLRSIRDRRDRLLKMARSVAEAVGTAPPRRGGRPKRAEQQREAGA
jgi:hypothetical protein